MKSLLQEDILSVFSELNINLSVQPNIQFYDEPQFFLYTSHIKNKRKYTDGYVKDEVPPGSGFSFSSSDEAFSKSLFELVERFCLTNYLKKDIIFKRFDKKSAFVDPSLFSNDLSIRDKKFGWTRGVTLKDGRVSFLPAQLVYLNYIRNKTEPLFPYPHNSNGAAAGKSRDQAILNGIYEIVERDAFMCIYLNRISPPVINLKLIKDKIFREIIEKCARYKLELYVLDITTDIGIPSYLSILIDRTGLGPAVSVGAKSGLKTKNTILGAIGESFMVRLYVKYMLKDGVIFGTSDAKKNNIFADRAEYWFTKDKIKDIEFLLTGKCKKERKGFSGTINDELKVISELLYKKGYDIYIKDLTMDKFVKSLSVCKVFIPGLQPLYLKESEKKISLNFERLKVMANFFSSNYKLNSIPHPFL